MLRVTTLVLCGLALAPIAACTGDLDRSEPDRERGGAQAALAADGWAAALAAEHDRVRDSDPVLYDRILHLGPQRTRNGALRFTDPVIHRPDAAPLLAHRMLATPDDPVLRAGLAEALPRTGGEFSETAVGLLAVETDELVRAVLVSTLRRATPAAATAGLRAGLSDPSPRVRAEAARTAARRADGAALAAELVGALEDEDAATRTEAVRALSALGLTEAVPSVRDRLADPDPAVRAAAERALVRLRERGDASG